MATHRFDPDFTDNVIKSMGPQTPERFREIMTSLIRHVHDFARETNLTVDEWMAGVKMMNWAGQMSDDKRNEGQLLCDVIGLESYVSQLQYSNVQRKELTWLDGSLVDEITYKLAQEAEDTPTATAILGPFFRPDTKWRQNGDNVVEGVKGGEMVFMHGRVIDFVTKKPLVNATVEMWEASTNGLYEQQDPEQVEHNLRGRFRTDEEGRYSYYCLRPTPYPVPDDGPAGKVLKLMDRHPFRPAHIHIIVRRRSIISVLCTNDHRPPTTATSLSPPRSSTAKTRI